MIKLRKASDRFHTQIGWLDSWHTFSFGEHFDPRQVGFSALRVINDDTVQPAQGFGQHPHRDMEIVSYVLSGALQHRDSTGGGGVIRPGDVQRMSAGRGVVHSEFNASREEAVHFLQIWILPERAGIEPGYEQKNFPVEERRGRLQLLASRDGRDGSLVIHQDAELHGALLAPGQRVSFDLKPSRKAWVHAARGSALVNGQRLDAGDGAAVAEESGLQLEGVSADAEVLLFDLP
ncbi:MAG TPA: pirin family protein [Myxococcales bacterium]|nr:pirin family protein [Myxococcales bacterium]